jgi:hypothetical protein
VVSVDPAIQREPQDREKVDGGQCYIVGYGVTSHSFFQHNCQMFLSLG